MNFASRIAALTIAALLVGWSLPASAQTVPPASNLPPPQRTPGPDYYGPDELVSSGQRFFGNVSYNLPATNAIYQLCVPKILSELIT